MSYTQYSERGIDKWIDRSFMAALLMQSRQKGKFAKIPEFTRELWKVVRGLPGNQGRDGCPCAHVGHREPSSQSHGLVQA